MKRINIILCFLVLIVMSGCSAIFDVEIKTTEKETEISDVEDRGNTCELIGKEKIEIIKLEKETLELSEEIEPDVIYTFYFNYQIEKTVETKLNANNELYTYEHGIYSEVDVEVYDGQGTRIQTISYEVNIYADEAIFRTAVIDDIQIVDFNFDGYPDILSKKEIGGNKGNFSCIGWIYQPETGLFIEANISDIVNMSIDNEHGILRSENNSGGIYSFYIYKFQNDKFELTNQLVLTHLRDKEVDIETLDYNYIELAQEVIKVEVTENSNGTMQDVFPLKSDTPEGRQQIIDYLYSEHSLWVNDKGYIGPFKASE
ncbi:XAC2610-related protein [Breznakia pachnodae]|uniref:Uncharacterized protein n=1 Tax=Breznakia pachnodae TaxID=265178 RepID=A0ABU0E5C7_9FIRM|nr:hypothetical protein [Breznakia pachnodae]MDQ0362021.1 hypothetical protein [Breznakia pachnodae]